MCCTRVERETAEVAVLTTGRREAARKTWIDWTERGSDLSALPRRSSSGLIGPFTGFNESILTASTVLANGVYLTCDAHRSPLWRAVTICCVFTVILFLILHLTDCCLLSPPPPSPTSFPEQRHRSADARGVSESHQRALHGELHVNLLLSAPICSLAHQP